ncbi:MAG: DUF2721 domain-containing protein [Candidatus Eremiobacteraeota bacterium]|nr:DUF2721 domain-containing protein [Candidatus Eremiobacteraeota bacterium]
MSLVGALVTPAILILAAGSLVASTLVRLGRIVDQTRHLIEQADQLRRAGKPAGVIVIIDNRIDRQLRRAELTRNGLWGYYVAIVLFLTSSVVLALSPFIPVSFHWIGPTIVLLGGFVLIVATAQLVIEVGLSAGSLREEVESYRRGDLEG